MSGGGGKKGGGDKPPEKVMTPKMWRWVMFAGFVSVMALFWTSYLEQKGVDIDRMTNGLLKATGVPMRHDAPRQTQEQPRSGEYTGRSCEGRPRGIPYRCESATGWCQCD